MEAPSGAFFLVPFTCLVVKGHFFVRVVRQHTHQRHIDEVRMPMFTTNSKSVIQKIYHVKNFAAISVK